MRVTRRSQYKVNNLSEKIKQALRVKKKEEGIKLTDKVVSAKLNISLSHWSKIKNGTSLGVSEEVLRNLELILQVKLLDADS